MVGSKQAPFYNLLSELVLLTKKHYCILFFKREIVKGLRIIKGKSFCYIYSNILKKHGGKKRQLSTPHSKHMSTSKEGKQVLKKGPSTGEICWPFRATDTQGTGGGVTKRGGGTAQSSCQLARYGHCPRGGKGNS